MLISITALVQAYFGCVKEDKTKNKTAHTEQTKTMSYNKINVRQEEATLFFTAD